MSEVVKPTVEEIRGAVWEDNDDFMEVHESLDDSWRHGNIVTKVFKRISDETYWQITYKVSGDGEYNSLRDGSVYEDEIIRVVPTQVVKIEYRPATETVDNELKI